MDLSTPVSIYLLYLGVSVPVRYFFALRWLALGMLLVPLGCQSQDSEEELGTIVYEVPDVPGSDKPFPLPDLDLKAKPKQQPANPFGLPN